MQSAVSWEVVWKEVWGERLSSAAMRLSVALWGGVLETVSDWLLETDEVAVLDTELDAVVLYVEDTELVTLVVSLDVCVLVADCVKIAVAAACWGATPKGSSSSASHHLSLS